MPLELEKMTVKEKLRALELLWDDLCRHAEGVPSPKWHEEILADRVIRHEAGEDPALDWRAAKERIRNNLP
ncbi:addiction module protein [Geoalkalibacter halelectricus]|uniref:Addiction module protein n=1 Tax=Geoalkalibacter halelectricus TaxID=2847045 RepID=A0ABY5ZQX4_9BACT|nr:addiction module protein [Geoalkalibacter halelectricus]MDO3378410.1 addiction module protein [Geoalkalibacter halelectricus]UWZ80270.1 addiction module protein [Geoalkalibacter halelectricus]